MFLGDAAGALFAEEERGREVIVMCASRHVSSDWRPAMSTASLFAPLKEDKDSHLARLVDTRCRRSEIERSTRPATDSVPMVGRCGRGGDGPEGMDLRAFTRSVRLSCGGRAARPPVRARFERGNQHCTSHFHPCQGPLTWPMKQPVLAALH